MKIIRLYPFIPPNQGGIELHAHNLSCQQRRLGHEVTMLFNDGRGLHPNDISIANWLNLRRIRSQLVKDVIFYVSAFLYCIKHKIRHDVLHVHGDLSAFLLGSLIAFAVKPCVRVASIHSALRAGFWHRFYGHILSSYDVVYCTGLREVKQLQALGLSQARWQPSGVSDEFVKESIISDKYAKTIDVICVASLVPIKNINLLIEVAKCLPQYTFEVVGDGPLRAELLANCAGSNVSNVTFIGNVDRATLATRLASARVFYLPSFSEGTPTAMMEAMTMGLPVVVTPSNDYSDIILSGINGYTTLDFSVQSSVDAISCIFSDFNEYSSISNSNRVVSKDMTWAAVAQRVTEWMKLK